MATGGFSCRDAGQLQWHHPAGIVRAPAGRTRPGARNGVRFLQRHGHYGGCKWCSTVLSIPAHGAVNGSLLNELLVAVLQVDEVGEFSGREIADFRGASRAEMEGWVAEKQVYGELRGATQPGRALCRGLAHWLGGWRL